MPAPRRPSVSIVAAVASNSVIGRDNALPWRLPEDLRRFRDLTWGHPIVMGRKTWESLGRPLPGRRNLVVSRDPGWRAQGAEGYASLESALAACAAQDEVFVIGGAELYRAALPIAQRLYLTEIAEPFEGDTRFPEWDRDAWREASREPGVSAGGLRYAFVRYERATDPPQATQSTK